MERAAGGVVAAVRGGRFVVFIYMIGAEIGAVFLGFAYAHFLLYAACMPIHIDRRFARVIVFPSFSGMAFQRLSVSIDRHGGGSTGLDHATAVCPVANAVAGETLWRIASPE
jgi:hypothetical protein